MNMNMEKNQLSTMGERCAGLGFFFRSLIFGFKVDVNFALNISGSVLIK